MKLLALIISILIVTNFCIAQSSNNRATIKGKITNKSTSLALANTPIKVLELNVTVYSDEVGNFQLSSIAYGSYTLEIEDIKLKILVDGTSIDLGELKIEVNPTENYFGATEMGIVYDDIGHATVDDGLGNEYIPLVQTDKHNSIISGTNAHFLTFGYKPRGYEGNRHEVYINNLRTNNLISGISTQEQWSGLQEVLAASTLNVGLEHDEQYLGGIGSVTGINAFASNKRANTSIAYTITNRVYRHQLNLAHHTGMMSNGIAISFVFNTRRAESGYIPGTYHQSYGYAIAASKNTGQKSKIHLLSFGTTIKRGNASSVTEEMYKLSGNKYYNPNWGYQEGEKRNAKEYQAFAPTTILNWEYKKQNSLQINTGIAVQVGRYGQSSLDWYNATDPRADYYNKLPSYYRNDPQGANLEEAHKLEQYYKDNPDALQIDWEKMYEANRLNKQILNGIIGNRSVYALGQDKIRLKTYSLFSNFQKSVNSRYNLSGGLYYQIQQTEHYREMLDLLGGDYYVNHNRFAEQIFIGSAQHKQNDLNNPDALVYVGDKYNYHYSAFIQKGNIWMQSEYNLGKFDLHGALAIGMDNYYRIGNYKNGVYPTESYGKSKVYKFTTGKLRGAITYKISGRQHLRLSGLWMQEAPMFDNIFIAPKIRNTGLNSVQKETIMSGELAYLYEVRKLLFTIKAYTTEINETTQTLRFYHEEIQNFVSYAMQNIDTRHLGIELFARVKLYQHLSFVSAINLMQAFYSNRPNVSIYKDNDTSGVIIQESVYINNYFLGNRPQNVYNAGIIFSNNTNWNVNFFANISQNNYISINPTRRTERATTNVPSNTILHDYILSQQKLPAYFTLDFRIGKSMDIASVNKRNKNTLKLNITTGVNNLLKNRNIVTNFNEQLRYDFTAQNPDIFPPKYRYALGRNYYVNLKITF